MQVTYTEQEANDLIELLNIANKAAGLAVAESALHNLRKLQAAANEPAEAPRDLELYEPETDND